MASLIEVLLAFITAISIFIIFLITGSLSPQFQVFKGFFISLGIASIITSPLSSFFITLSVSYFSGLLYNILAPQIGGIKFRLKEKDITHISVISITLILAVIVTIWAFIIGLILGVILAVLNVLPSGLTPAFNELTFGLIPIITNSIYTTLPPLAGLGGAVTLIMGLPIMAFIISFIDTAVIVLLYNYVGSKAAYFQLNFIRINGNIYKLKSIPVLPITLVAGVISGVLGLLIIAISLLGFIDLVNLASAGNIIGIVLSRDDLLIYLIPYILFAALIAIFYNFLVPKIGGIELELE